ncbi:ammonium transporter 3 member 1-like [Diospyros lotus]|uniref:ammonium transporter 3 member 1-like n=1 Tax=Diospyros lotus TaxID=55363 RepID=UPI00224CBFC5|nr:ammonium transporter 3 member 1-like [Diospyros lotus]
MEVLGLERLNGNIGKFRGFVKMSQGIRGLVQGWVAIIMGVFFGTVPWFTMMIVYKRSKLPQHVDDMLGVFHTHVVTGFLEGVLTSLFAELALCALFLLVTNSREGVYSRSAGEVQILKQILGASFVIGWNLVVTSIICLMIKLVARIPLWMSDEQLKIKNDALYADLFVVIS